MIKLNNGRILLEILPEKGGTISSLKYFGEEILYCNLENMLSKERPRSGIPILFPCCGRVTDNKVVFDHKEYSMPMHGFGHLLPWKVVEKNFDNSVTLELISSDETKQYYPYDFVANISHKLLKNSLKIEFVVKNIGNNIMPFVLGFHPYFIMEQVDDVKIFIDGCDFIDYNSGERIYYAKPIVFHGDNEITYIYERPSAPIVIKNEKLGYKIIMKSDEYFSKVVLWKGINSKFVCVEPWGAMPNALNTGDGKYLLPEETFECCIIIEIV
ncbi:hypothetical protein [Fusobacterium sp. PH5-44]|uniref:aldose epimerase family protein n=1 Tax=unclassified Fusobacterium TaxID=2648384 RepID=UPI003D25B132